MEETDGFDRLPDALILQIMNLISDAKTLTRCRSVSRRFNSIVPQTDTLLLRIDRVISSDSESLFLSLFKSLLHLFLSSSNAASSGPARSKSSRAAPPPAQILSRFDRIRFLTVELPAGDLKFEKGRSVVVRWRAEFGRSLRSCVILGFRSVVSGAAAAAEEEEEREDDSTSGIKARVVWTISALIAASARHYLLKEVVRGREEIERVVLSDRDGEGTVVMEKDGLLEYHISETERGKNCVEEDEEEDGDGEEENEEVEEERNRTVVPSVKMRMRHVPRIRLKGGQCAVGATLVVVRPNNAGAESGCRGAGEEEDAELALRAFGGGVYGDAVRALLKSKCYLVEMNSF